jgi:perosamine synthetase
MTDLQAAIGLVQLKKLDQFIQERQYWANYYREHLASLRWLKPQAIPEYCSQHAWQAFVCYVDPNMAPKSRNEIMDNLQLKQIATRPGTHAVHLLSYYRDNLILTQTIFLEHAIAIKTLWQFHFTTR